MHSAIFKKVLGIWLIVLMFGVVLVGCAGPAAPPEEPAAPPEEPAVQQGSLTVTPSSVELGMGMVKQKITFTGAGFGPEDRVSIVLVSAWEGEDVEIATATADESGAFTTDIGATTKIMTILHVAAPGWEPPYPEGTPPLAPGTYAAKAISWDSNVVATCSFELKAPAE